MKEERKQGSKEARKEARKQGSKKEGREGKGREGKGREGKGREGRKEGRKEKGRKEGFGLEAFMTIMTFVFWASWFLLPFGFLKCRLQLNFQWSGKGGRNVGSRGCAVTLSGAGGAATLRRCDAATLRRCDALGGGWRCDAVMLRRYRWASDAAALLTLRRCQAGATLRRC